MSLTDQPSETLSPAEAAQKLRLLLARVEQQMGSAALPEATPSRGPKRLTIGMATYDDYDGVYFTVQALRMYHPEVMDDVELLVIDNHPEGIASDALKGLDGWIPNYRYFPYRAWRGTAVRDLVFREASGEYVLCLDAHVLIVPGAIQKLLCYFDAHPHTTDLLQGPLLYDDLDSISTHFNPEWRSSMFGTWDADERGRDLDAPPFEIPMQGLGLFACRRAAWLGFNPKMRGFGGEEGYIHAKFRQIGARTLCLPFLRWTHRFTRPSGVPYPFATEDRLRNYVLALRELGQDEGDFVAHFREGFGTEVADRLIAQVRAEVENPFCYFDATYCINLDTEIGRWEQMAARFSRLGIAWQVRRFSAIPTPPSHHIGCALSHRAIIAEAKRYGLSHVLVLEDDAIFHQHTLEYLGRVTAELDTQDWDLLYLGGHRWAREYRLAPGCEYLERPEGLTCTHAVAYHHSIYDRILADLPDTVEGMTTWLQRQHGIDQYLMGLNCRKFLTRPALATQPFLVKQEDITQRDRYVI
jgi:hypothetical protein